MCCGGVDQCDFGPHVFFARQTLFPKWKFEHFNSFVTFGRNPIKSSLIVILGQWNLSSRAFSLNKNACKAKFTFVLITFWSTSEKSWFPLIFCNFVDHRDLNVVDPRNFGPMCFRATKRLQKLKFWNFNYVTLKIVDLNRFLDLLEIDQTNLSPSCMQLVNTSGLRTSNAACANHYFCCQFGLSSHMQKSCRYRLSFFLWVLFISLEIAMRVNPRQLH